MTPPFVLALRAFDVSLLRGASLLVPGKQRAEWWREWRSELWHVRRECSPGGTVSLQAEREVTAFCLGAFPDALCLGRRSWRMGSVFAVSPGSPGRCLLWLSLALVASYTVALLSPGARTEIHPSLYHVRPGLMLIQDARYNNDSAATISIEQLRTWEGRWQKYFDDFAFYRITQERVSTATATGTRWNVACASSNLFALLGLSVRDFRAETEGEPNVPAIVLSDEAWSREFGRNPHALGSLMKVGEHTARVVGVLSEGAWRLPGQPDAWLLQPDSEIASGGLGYAVAHLTNPGQSEMWTSRVHITAYNLDDSIDDLWGVAFEERTRGPRDTFWFTVLLALLSLPAITSVSMGEAGYSLHKPSWRSKLCRWLFMSAKIVLLLPIVYFSSIDISYWHTTHYSNASEYAQLISSFSMCLFGLRWALLDQRQRCPVCLRRVTNPARVGHASRTFLAWYGMELICTEGHTLLHVPGMPTSWFSAQRWLYLDTSWEFLFASSSVG
ncbi:MAG: hypothetical protein WB608_14765 [Terracidiphilus sp.]